MGSGSVIEEEGPSDGAVGGEAEGTIGEREQFSALALNLVPGPT